MTLNAAAESRPVGANWHLSIDIPLIEGGSAATARGLYLWASSEPLRQQGLPTLTMTHLFVRSYKDQQISLTFDERKGACNQHSGRDEKLLPSIANKQCLLSNARFTCGGLIQQQQLRLRKTASCHGQALALSPTETTDLYLWQGVPKWKWMCPRCWYLGLEGSIGWAGVLVVPSVLHRKYNFLQSCFTSKLQAPYMHPYSQTCAQATVMKAH